MSTLRAVADHEAGHAVVVHALGMERINLVTIVPDGDREGGVKCEPDSDAVDPAYRRAKVIASFAGRIAQARINPEADLSFNDGWKRRSLVLELCDSEEEARALCDSCEEEAGRILNERWRAVEALADALLDRNVLTGDEAVAVIQEALRG